MKVRLDFETRSRVNLKTHKIYNYADDYSTEVMCCAVKVDFGKIRIWCPMLTKEEMVGSGLPYLSTEEFIEICAKGDTFHAHSAQFERLIYHAILVIQFGFPPIPTSKFRCTAALAASLALPRALGAVADVISAPVQKDAEGHRLMMKLCRPNAKGEFVAHKSDIVRLCLYCITDVLAEEAVEEMLPAMRPDDQRSWELDQIINDRGIRVDVTGATKLLAMVETRKAELKAEVLELTGGISPSQIKASIEWLESEGVEVENMRKATITAALKGKPNEKAKRFMEIRQSLAKASVGKIKTLLRMVSKDGRIRGCHLYWGATTGRAAGIGFQPHNLPRDSYNAEMVEKVLAGDFEGCPFFAASRCIRGLLLVGCGIDFSAIEGRITAWLAEEEDTLKAYYEGKSTYKVAAAAIFGCHYDQVTPEQRQIGKVAELALGFQGWIGAFYKMAESYPDVKAEIDTWGLPQADDPIEWDELTRAERKDERTAVIVKKWRAAHPATREAWKNLNEAAILTVKTGKPHRYGRITFGIKGIFLYMRLPSGRCLSYPYPEIEMVETKYGQLKKSVTFMTVDQKAKGAPNKWVRQSTYGGKIFENAVQGIDHDMLLHAINNFELLGQEVVLHVHDQQVCDPSPGVQLRDLEKVMCDVPSWAAGLPVAAEGWFDKRYRK